MPIGQPFNLQFKDGDVIYGKTEPRLRYIASLPAVTVHRLRSEGKFLFIDDYNCATFAHVPESLEAIIENRLDTKADIRFNVQANRNDDESLPAQRAASEKYYAALRRSRHAPLTAVTMNMTKVMAKGNRNRDEFLIRRACKFGLEYIIDRCESTVHFALDCLLEGQSELAGARLDFLRTVTKARNSDGTFFSITDSELRCCYRNRHKWEHTDKLKFYGNMIQIEPPWRTNPGEWGIYERHRIAKGKVEPSFERRPALPYRLKSGLPSRP